MHRPAVASRGGQRRPRARLLIIANALLLSVGPVLPFAPSGSSPLSIGYTRCELLRLRAAPKRLEDNVEGVLYVNDRCINCAACSNFAPTVFERNDGVCKHVVFHQPALSDREEIASARAALAACPVAAIRLENEVKEGGRELKEALSDRNSKPFPQPLYPIKFADGEILDIGVYYLGHHNDKSFGATPYLVNGRAPSGEEISVMVDVPRFGASAVRAVKSLAPTGPDYMFLTHVDDTADHLKWKEEFPSLKRIFHSGDLGRHNWVGDLTLEDVEVLLQGESGSGSDEELVAWDLDGSRTTKSELQDEQFLILHTPGHSPGSISLLFRPKSPSPHLQGRLQTSTGNRVAYPRGVLFTGDTYAWTTREGGHMSGFPRYGNNLLVQSSTLQKLGSFQHQWDIVAPGHGHPRFYLEQNEAAEMEREQEKQKDLDDAMKELQSYR